MTDFIAHFQQFARSQGFRPDTSQMFIAAELQGVSAALTKPDGGGFWFRRSKPKPPAGLYIWGGVGRGKTMLMDLFFDYVPIAAKRRVHFNLFMLDVHNTIGLLRAEGKGREPLKTIAKTIAADIRLLCFDEFQVYDIADAMVLSGLFSELFDQGVTVIATSNVPPADLYKGGLQRARFLPFVELLSARMDVIHMDGERDYRLLSRPAADGYFINDAGGLKALFESLVEGKSAAPETLRVRGRSLAAGMAADGCGWFTFHELCEKPRGAADYEAVANRFHTVFIEFVPRMGYDRRNELKRFILLVDTLYDAGIRLFVNAESAPETLYTGRDHAFEFERTASRLHEMRMIAQGRGPQKNAHREDAVVDL